MERNLTTQSSSASKPFAIATALSVDTRLFTYSTYRTFACAVEATENYNIARWIRKLSTSMKEIFARRELVDFSFSLSDSCYLYLLAKQRPSHFRSLLHYNNRILQVVWRLPKPIRKFLADEIHIVEFLVRYSTKKSSLFRRIEGETLSPQNYQVLISCIIWCECWQSYVETGPVYRISFTFSKVRM